jgi:hypothetical protein
VAPGCGRICRTARRDAGTGRQYALRVTDDQTCSFCGKDDDPKLFSGGGFQVVGKKRGTVIALPTVYICGECVELLHEQVGTAHPPGDLAGIPALVDAIRHMHGCDAKHAETVQVVERAPTGERVWRGYVEVFDLVDHTTAKRAYAWSEATTGVKRRFFAALHVPPVDSPAAAVRASIVRDSKR